MAKKSKKVKFTQNQLLFKKQQKRIKKIIRQAEKVGISFRDEELEKILQQPQRITRQRLEALKEITPKKLVTRYGYTGSGDSGEVITGGNVYKNYLSRRKAEAVTRKARRRALADAAIEHFEWVATDDERVAPDDYSIIETIKAELENLAEQKRGEVYTYKGATGGFILIGEYTNTLLSVFEHIVEANKENRAELAAYLERNEAAISRAIYVLSNYKGASTVSEAYAEMVNILRGAPNGGIAIDEAYDITNDSDLYGEEYDDEF